MTILNQIRNAGRRQALPPTTIKQEAWQRPKMMNLFEYILINCLRKARFILALVVLNNNVFAKDCILNIYIAANYLANDTANSFKSRYECRVEQNFFNENDEMLAKMAAGASGYDIIVPTSYAVDSLIRMGKLEKLNKTRLPNLKNIDPQFLNPPYDNGNQYSVPYAYDNVMLAYNKDVFKRLGIKADSWAIIFDPKYLKLLKGKITVLNSQRNVFAAALLYLGKDPNSTKREDLDAARNLIERAKPYWAKFDSDTYYRSLLRGNIWVAMSYSVDIFKTIADQKLASQPVTIEAELQREGNMYELDNLVIPKTAENIDKVYTLINYLLEPSSAIELSAATGASIMNLPALKNINPELKQIDWIYPKNMTKMHSFKNYDPKTRVYVNEVWLELQLS